MTDNPKDQKKTRGRPSGAKNLPKDPVLTAVTLESIIEESNAKAPTLETAASSHQTKRPVQPISENHGNIPTHVEKILDSEIWFGSPNVRMDSNTELNSRTEEVVTNRIWKRFRTDTPEFHAMRQSVRSEGILQPIIVIRDDREVTDPHHPERTLRFKYRLISGFTRVAVAEYENQHHDYRSRNG